MILRKPTNEGAVIAPQVAALPDEWYILSGDFCQWGSFGSLPCGPCKVFTINIYKPGDETTIVGQLCKVWAGCIKEALTDADTFTISFPEDATPEQKAGLMAACVVLDFLFFENNSGRNQNRGASGF